MLAGAPITGLCSALPEMPRKSSSNGNHPEELPLAIFMDRYPESYAKIVKFLEEGHSPAGTAALCRAPLSTVRQIRAILGESAIMAGIRGLGRNLLEASQNMSERLANESGEIPIHLLPGALAATVDRALLVHGNPTAIIGHTQAKDVPTPEQLAAMFAALPLANASPVERENAKLEPDPLPPPRLEQES